MNQLPPGTADPEYQHAGHNGQHYFWSSYHIAKRLADRLSSDDPEWRYEVRKESNDTYVIQVWDEENHFIANL